MMRKSIRATQRNPSSSAGMDLRRLAGLEQKRPEEPLRERARSAKSRFADWLTPFRGLLGRRVGSGTGLYVSPSFERMWGFTAEALYREPRLWAETIHPRIARASPSGSAAGLREDIHYHDVEYRILQPGGTSADP